MSVLASFIEHKLISVLEATLLSHAPELQAELLDDLKMLGDKGLAWVEDKIKACEASK